MVIINRNDLTIRTMNRVNARRLMQDRTVTGYGAEVLPAGVLSPRPFLWPQLALPASTPGNLAKGDPVHSKRTAEPETEVTRLGSSQLCAPATTAQK